ncbi:MAG TPA: PilN domain-containing protein [Candidatus Baltobacteraceae bacterium]|nr:PilN domain-containing protein [Candidatus Baltobacteraceae bacterium]
MLIPGFNLGSTDYARTRRVRTVLAVSSGVLLLLLVGQLAAWGIVRRTDTRNAARLETLQAELRQHQAALQSVKAQIPADVVKRAEGAVAGYNAIIEAAAFSWIGLLVDLEKAVPPGVVLADIQPDPTSGAVALRGSARSFEELSKLVSALQSEPHFSEVFLRHQAEKPTALGAAGQLEFSLNLKYRGRPS